MPISGTEKLIEIDAKFCTECGRNLENVKNMMPLDDDRTLCGACYQKMAFPNLHDATMEACD